MYLDIIICEYCLVSRDENHMENEEAEKLASSVTDIQVISNRVKLPLVISKGIT